MCHHLSLANGCASDRLALEHDEPAHLIAVVAVDTSSAPRRDPRASIDAQVHLVHTPRNRDDNSPRLIRRPGKQYRLPFSEVAGDLHETCLGRTDGQSDITRRLAIYREC